MAFLATFFWGWLLGLARWFSPMLDWVVHRGQGVSKRWHWALRCLVAVRSPPSLARAVHGRPSLLARSWPHHVSHCICRLRGGILLRDWALSRSSPAA